MQQICRTCLQKITDYNFVILNNDPRSLQVSSQLSFCVPELDLNAIKEPILCGNCVSMLHLASNFKRKCLRTEELTWSYKQSEGLDGESVDILDIYGKTDYLHSECCFVIAQKSINLPFIEVTSPTPHEICDTIDLEDDKDSVIKIEDNVIKDEQVDYDFVKDENDILVEETELNKTLEEHVLDEDQNLEDHVLIVPPNLLGCQVLLNDLNVTNFITENRIESNQVESSTNTELHDPENLLHVASIQANSTKDLHNTTENLPHKHNIKANSKNENEQNIMKPSTSKCTKNSNHKSPYTCSVCKFKTVDIKPFHNHMQTHTVNCKKCKYSTKYKQNLKKHMRTHSTKKIKKCVSCSDCDFSTIDHGALIKHKKIHINKKSEKLAIICNVCGKHFARNYNLAKHKKIHATKPTINCAFCEVKFTNKNLLKQHVKIHFCEKTNLGDSNSKKTSNLKGSGMVTNGRKPHSCTVCKRDFIVMAELLNHQRIHDDELTCIMCNIKFSCKTVFLRHLKIHIF